MSRPNTPCAGLFRVSHEGEKRYHKHIVSTHASSIKDGFVRKHSNGLRNEVMGKMRFIVVNITRRIRVRDLGQSMKSQKWEHFCRQAWRRHHVQVSRPDNDNST